jgi:hypothetical protein
MALPFLGQPMPTYSQPSEPHLALVMDQLPSTCPIFGASSSEHGTMVVVWTQAVALVLGNLQRGFMALHSNRGLVGATRSTMLTSFQPTTMTGLHLM